MWMKLSLFVLFAVILVVSARHHKKHCNRRFRGCSISARQCVCGTAVDCHNPFHYKNRYECQTDLQGGFDKCKHVDCGKGICLQTKRYSRRRAICDCWGSGLWGKRCEYVCPHVNGLPDDSYPEQCLTI